MNNNFMVFRRSYLEAVEKIAKDTPTRLKLLKAIVNYGLTGKADIPEDLLFQIAPELKKDYEERSGFNNG